MLLPVSKAHWAEWHLKWQPLLSLSARTLYACQQIVLLVPILVTGAYETAVTVRPLHAK